MCKLYCILEIENLVKAEKLARKAIPFITRQDGDGLGVMWLGDGAIHSKKWVTPPRSIDAPQGVAIKSKFAGALKIEYSEKGTRPATIDAIALHARKATCGINIENTHPFQTAKTALIHNGIIHNTTPADNKLSTCDSEKLLWQYLNHGVREHPEHLTEALADVMGYYACMVFNTNGVIDIFVDGSATLFMGNVLGVGTVIATSKENLSGSVKKAGFKLAWLYPVKAFSHIRWDRARVEIRTFEKPSATGPALVKRAYGQVENWQNDFHFEDQIDRIKSIKSV